MQSITPAALQKHVQTVVWIICKQVTVHKVCRRNDGNVTGEQKKAGRPYRYSFYFLSSTLTQKKFLHVFSSLMNCNVFVSVICTWRSTQAVFCTNFSLLELLRVSSNPVVSPELVSSEEQLQTYCSLSSKYLREWRRKLTSLLSTPTASSKKMLEENSDTTSVLFFLISRGMDNSYLTKLKCLSELLA